MLLSDSGGCSQNGLESYCLYHPLLSSAAGTLSVQVMDGCHEERRKVASEPPPPARSVSFLSLSQTPGMEVFVSGGLVLPSLELSVGQKLESKLLSRPPTFVSVCVVGFFWLLLFSFCLFLQRFRTEK